MRVFNITVDGKTYEVEVEEKGSASPLTSRPAAVASATAPVASTPAAKAAPQAAQKQETTVSAGQEVLAAPMPGTIHKIMKKPGEVVAEGDIILILEAMKMENEILAPRAGKVSSIAVNEGASVNTGDTLAVID